MWLNHAYGSRLPAQDPVESVVPSWKLESESSKLVPVDTGENIIYLGAIIWFLLRNFQEHIICPIDVGKSTQTTVVFGFRSTFRSRCSFTVGGIRANGCQIIHLTNKWFESEYKSSMSGWQKNQWTAAWLPRCQVCYCRHLTAIRA